MKINKIKISSLVIFLVFLELFTNNVTPLYVDVLGVLLVIWLVNDSYSLHGLVVLSLLADLIGNWYLGSHLIIILLLSFITANVTHFYRICGFWQKNILLIFFYSLFCVALVVLSFITGRYNFNWINYICELVIYIPLVNYFFIKVIDNSSDDLILHD